MLTIKNSNEAYKYSTLEHLASYCATTNLVYLAQTLIIQMFLGYPEGHWSGTKDAVLVLSMLYHLAQELILYPITRF